MRIFLLTFLLFWMPAGALASPDPVDAVQRFEKAWPGAKSWQDLQGFFNQATLKALAGLPRARQAETFAEQSKYMQAIPQATIKKQVQGNKATVQLHSETSKNGGKNITTRTYDLDLENGQWKIDYLDPLDVDDGSED